MMKAPKALTGSWIKIQSSANDRGIDGYVINKLSDECLEVGYYQNRSKAIKDDVIWAGEFWKFKYDGPSGSYLRGHEEFIVKNDPNLGQYQK